MKTRNESSCRTVITSRRRTALAVALANTEERGLAQVQVSTAPVMERKKGLQAL